MRRKHFFKTAACRSIPTDPIAGHASPAGWQAQVEPPHHTSQSCRSWMCPGDCGCCTCDEKDPKVWVGGRLAVRSHAQAGRRSDVHKVACHKTSARQLLHHPQPLEPSNTSQLLVSRALKAQQHDTLAAAAATAPQNCRSVKRDHNAEHGAAAAWRTVGGWVPAASWPPAPSSRGARTTCGA